MVGDVGKVLKVREGCLTLGRKDANELNERISREGQQGGGCEMCEKTEEW